MDFRSLLRSLRGEKGLKISHLAKRAGYSRPTIRGYESGRYPPPEPKIVHALCDALEVSPDMRDTMLLLAYKANLELTAIRYLSAEELLSIP